MNKNKVPTNKPSNTEQSSYSSRSKTVLNDMEIYPVNVEDDEKNNSIAHRNFDVLLKPPFNAILYGSSQTGKTTGLINIITRQGMNGGMYGADEKCRVFDDIIVISSTLMSDEVIKPLLDITTATYDYYDDDLIKGIVELQRQRKARGETKNVLIIMDDIVTMIKPTAHIFKAMTNARHDRISIMILVQNVRGTLPPVARSNAHMVFCWRLHSMKERIKLFEELGFLDSENEVANMYNHCTKDPYNFMYVNAKKLKVYKNLTDNIWNRYLDTGQYAPSFSGKKFDDGMLETIIEE
jgi:hypothetical protein|tara:strand:+ start:1673 stop:2557 length:885 start_codon:yes stop_codon:yes gene_type:complete